MPNRLAASTSPYLRQHAHNPVDWQPWDEAALETARREAKPIFLSIGYAACHWCHVMAHESFEDAATAAFLNARFVCIKVDREERPDLDGLYMAAVTAMTGSGGWPMSVFLTPDQRPFYGGTYFPPEPRHGLPAFRDLLATLAEAWASRREEILRIASELSSQIADLTGGRGTGGAFDRGSLAAAVRALAGSQDRTHGGWGSAPKFPQPMAVDFLLARHTAGEEGALDLALKALRAMARGGMYDVVGGGFARYSTDPFWRVPHFEKMLYDNAQLVRAYIHGWQVTGDPAFRRVAEETLGFVAREMLAAEGGFHSSLDADSEGEEGRFYVWTPGEIRAALGEDAAFIEAAYGITAIGNWEGRTVLQRELGDADLADRFGLTVEQAVAKLSGCHIRLLETRNCRVRPGTDDKTLTSWNGLMAAAFAEAGRVFGKPRYLGIAARNADFLLTNLRPEGRLRRVWRAGRTGREVFLDDYAAFILGLLELYRADFDVRWFREAMGLAGEMIERFSDPAGGFFDTPDDAEALIARPKELQDNATPCGNSLAAEALLKLAALAEMPEWRDRAEKALGLVAGSAVRHPTAFGRWLWAASFATGEILQTAIIGDLGDERTEALIGETRREFRPNLIVAASSFPPPGDGPALLAGRPMAGGCPTAYVCQGFVCRPPVTSANELSGLFKT